MDGIRVSLLGLVLCTTACAVDDATAPTVSRRPHFDVPSAAPAVFVQAITDLGTLGGTFSRGLGIDDYGQSAGWTRDASNQVKGFLWTPTAPRGTVGSMVDLGTNYVPALNGINANGVIAGTLGPLGVGPFAAAVWDPTQPNGTTGQLVFLPPNNTGSPAVGATRVNLTGQVSGAVDNGTGSRATLWTPIGGGNYSVTDLLAGLATPSSTAVSVNEYGQVVGQYDWGTSAHGFLWTPNAPNGTTGSWVDLGSMGPRYAAGLFVNARGDVVGGLLDPTSFSTQHPFLWHANVPNTNNGTLIDLGLPPNTMGAQATSMNDAGYISGLLYDLNGRNRAFLWEPNVPNGTQGVFYDIGVTGLISIAFSINSYLEATGDYQQTSTSVRHAYLWTNAGGADLSLAFASAPPPFTVNVPVTLQLLEYNSGPTASTGATFTVTGSPGFRFVSATGATCVAGPAGLKCTLSAVPIGGQLNFSVTVRAIQTGTFPVKLTMTGNEPDTNSGNNTISKTVHVN